MEMTRITLQDRRRLYLSRPVLVLALSGLGLLAIAISVLVGQFDLGERKREQEMLTRGLGVFARDMSMMIAASADSDDAIAALGPRVNPAWIDRHIAGSLGMAFPGTRVLVFDRANAIAYDSATRNGAGRRADLRADGRPHARADVRADVRADAPADTRADMRPDAQSVTAAVTAIMPGLRAGAAVHLPRGGGRAAGPPPSPPITRPAFVMANGQLHIIIAAQVGQDGGARARGRGGAGTAMVAAALPVDSGVMRLFAERYLTDGLSVETGGRLGPGLAAIPVDDADGVPIARLVWHPRTPGTDLLTALLWPMACFLLLFALVSWRLARQSTMIASDLIASEAHARHLAFHDTLTQMPNRALMFDRLRTHIAAIRRNGGMVAVHCLDLDRFKNVNDTLGHQAGDELIRKVSAMLVAMCRETDTVARLGGDEFVILQPDATAAGASHLGERILAALKPPIDLDYGAVEIGCSIGVTLIDNPETDANEALRQADMSLYESKEAGRNRVTFFEPDMDAALRMRRGLETELRRALSGDSLTMVYQPQMDQRGHVDSMEALLRWDHPERGMIPPAVFVPLAEESGLILDLGEYVFRRVFAETRTWQGVTVAINVSALQLRSLTFMSMLTRLVAEHGIDASRYEIEITETALLGDDMVTRNNITVLKQEGFTIALDDFGTGYSSLSSLQRFAVDKIKIDRSFVRNLEADVEAEALVDAIVKLGRALKLDIVAEGVETEHQRERLLHCGCTQFQGFLVSHPVTAAEIERLLFA